MDLPLLITSIPSNGPINTSPPVCFSSFLLRQHLPKADIELDIDNKVKDIMYFDINKSFWNRGDYPSYYQNGSVATQVTNPWYSSENNAAPFDQGTLIFCSAAENLTDQQTFT